MLTLDGGWQVGSHNYKKLVDSVVHESTKCINELKNISIHMVEKTKDEWTSGYDSTRMDERRNNTSRPLMYERDVSMWMYKIKIIMNWMGCLKDMIIQYKNNMF